MPASPTQLTLKEFRKRGYFADVTEKWVPGANIRRDLFGFIDVVAIGNGECIGVQATTGKNHATRRRKILETAELNERANAWLRAGCKLAVWSWEKRGRFWQVREEQITRVIRAQVKTE